MLPYKTKVQVDFLEKNPDCDAVFGGVNIVDDEDRIIHKRAGKLGKYGFKELFLKTYSPAASTQMIRLSSLRMAGNYPVNLYIEDWYMWLRMASMGFKFRDVGHILVNYRTHSTNISGNFVEMNAAKEQILVEYSEHPLYDRARASSQVSSALDIQPASKLSSLSYMGSALYTSPAILFNKQFYRCLLKYFIPKRFIGRKKA
jgi:alpha-1,3-rhamnosyltransferase